MAMKFCLVNLLESIIIIKPICNHLCETMTKYKLFITFISSFFFLVNYKIATLTHYHSYLQWSMLNNGKGKLFITIRSSIFIMTTYSMLTWLQTYFHIYRSNYKYNYVLKWIFHQWCKLEIYLKVPDTSFRYR